MIRRCRFTVIANVLRQQLEARLTQTTHGSPHLIHTLNRRGRLAMHFIARRLSFDEIQTVHDTLRLDERQRLILGIDGGRQLIIVGLQQHTTIDTTLEEIIRIRFECRQFQRKLVHFFRTKTHQFGGCVSAIFQTWLNEFGQIRHRSQCILNVSADTRQMQWFVDAEIIAQLLLVQRNQLCTIDVVVGKRGYILLSPQTKSMREPLQHFVIAPFFH
mmetsp:Transcript_10706/g.16080  ORF Transcript_10706/g.16080 Transcript_10706/m.16080 type:complete len:216 (-) Transcript_10706:646-1293(-)